MSSNNRNKKMSRGARQRANRKAFEASPAGVQARREREWDERQKKVEEQRALATLQRQKIVDDALTPSNSDILEQIGDVEGWYIFSERLSESSWNPIKIHVPEKLSDDERYKKRHELEGNMAVLTKKMRELCCGAFSCYETLDSTSCLHKQKSKIEKNIKQSKNKIDEANVSIEKIDNIFDLLRKNLDDMSKIYHEKTKDNLREQIKAIIAEGEKDRITEIEQHRNELKSLTDSSSDKRRQELLMRWISDLEKKKISWHTFRCINDQEEDDMEWMNPEVDSSWTPRVCTGCNVEENLQEVILDDDHLRQNQEKICDELQEVHTLGVASRQSCVDALNNACRRIEGHIDLFKRKILVQTRELVATNKKIAEFEEIRLEYHELKQQLDDVSDHYQRSYSMHNYMEHRCGHCYNCQVLDWD